MLINERLVQDIRKIEAKLNSEGKLYSRSQLKDFYEIFRKQFGPDKLKVLDGELLLDLLHNLSNQDSLVYWLEFKNDEEFPAIFGSILGGSALKFEIYRRKETGAWMTGNPQNQKELTIDEAIQVARDHRDQLTRGVELLENLPTDATNSDYATLQQNLDKVAPAVSNSAWGHKYFSLLFPEKLDDYHIPDYQRFHLIKLRQSRYWQSLKG